MEHASDVSKPLLVVADDDADVRAFLAHLLTAWGYRVKIVADAAALRVLLGGERPALILLDMEFGEVHARELLQRPRAIGLDSPVVVLSGHSSPEAKAEMLRLGAVDFLAKPPPRVRLKEVIADTLTAGLS